MARLIGVSNDQQASGFAHARALLNAGAKMEKGTSGISLGKFGNSSFLYRTDCAIMFIIGINIDIRTGRMNFHEFRLSLPRGNPSAGRRWRQGGDGRSVLSLKRLSRRAWPSRLQQHIGAPCKPLVQKGDTVKAGQKIGEPVGFVSAAVHASISGKVVDVLPCIVANGTQVNAVVIDNDFQDTMGGASSRGRP